MPQNTAPGLDLSSPEALAQAMQAANMAAMMKAAANAPAGAGQFMNGGGMMGMNGQPMMNQGFAQQPMQSPVSPTDPTGGPIPMQAAAAGAQVKCPYCDAVMVPVGGKCSVCEGVL